MKSGIYITTIVLIAASCSLETSNKSNVENHLDTLPIPTDSAVLYFLSKARRQDTAINSLDGFVNSWYSKSLFTLREPVIYNSKSNREVYRFTWLRSFDNPISIRIEKHKEKITFFSKVANGAGGYNPGKLIIDTCFNISINDWTELNKRIDDAAFWTMSTESKERPGLDGAEWIIEALKDNKYHMVIRWSPFTNDQVNFRNIGEYLISVSKINIEPEANY